MNQNKLNFKFQESPCDQNKIAKYLFNLRFNFYQKSGKLSKPVKEKC